MTCPLCAKPAHPDYRPFCGRAHRDRDLLQWLGEGYRIPGRPIVDEDEAGLDSPGRPD
ncbi:DNA gyrase inhibitor YacG [uncultured Sphingomonas sp.]|uniref:DNA gyrase inhibitor YacG n=1 Tax=uncultured Sphingomonas sp. TaxID=158754 RepID=UPI0035CA85F2